MLFTVESNSRLTLGPRSCLLVRDNWNDWFKFETTFWLIVFDEGGQRVETGTLKIGQFGLTKEQRSPNIPNEFNSLGDEFFSVGQGEDYYEALSRLNPEFRREILSSLRDCAADLDLFERANSEEVMSESLLRSVSGENVRGRFHRLSRGDASLTQFRFSFQLMGNEATAPMLDFNVVPESSPPTNIHVLIGRNGVGKTTSLGRLTQMLMSATSVPGEISKLYDADSRDEWQFASLVSVAFSAFDPFVPIIDGTRGRNGLRFAYVGLKRTPQQNGTVPNLPPKSLEELASEFVESVRICRTGIKAERWRRRRQNDAVRRDSELQDYGLLIHDLYFINRSPLSSCR